MTFEVLRDQYNIQIIPRKSPGKIYFVLTFYITFVLATLFHEVMHGVVNGLTGGDFGFASDVGIIGGYDFINMYFFIPVTMVTFAEHGNRTAMLLAGPLSAIALGWYVGLRWNPSRVSPKVWERIRGIVWALMLRAGFDAIYLIPIDVFPDSPFHGDGVNLHHIWVDKGLFIEELFGIPWFFSLQHVIATLAVLGTMYVAWVLVKSQITKCSEEFFGSCQIQ